MKDDVKRFLTSINCVDDAFNEISLDKVVLKKQENKFIVYLKSENALEIEDANKLFLSALNGINGVNKCEIVLTYKQISESIVINYLNYLIDEIIIRRPSLISIKKSKIEINNNIITFFIDNKKC